MAAGHKKIEGMEIFHFEKDKIKEGWTVCNMGRVKIQKLCLYI